MVKSTFYPCFPLLAQIHGNVHFLKEHLQQNSYTSCFSGKEKALKIKWIFASKCIGIYCFQRHCSGTPLTHPKARKPFCLAWPSLPAKNCITNWKQHFAGNFQENIWMNDAITYPAPEKGNRKSRNDSSLQCP